MNKSGKRKIGIPHYGRGLFEPSIIKAGGVVVPISPKTYLDEIDECDGIVIPGGQDIWVGWYDKKMHPMTQKPNLERDALERALIKRALDNGQALLGVCRGHQMLNVTLGGSLHQHIHKHSGSRHVAFFERRSHWFDDVADTLTVNSLHHQAIDKLGNGLRIVAQAPDGTVEAIESMRHNFVVGVQFHPEMAYQDDFGKMAGKLFEKFVHANG